MSYVLMLVLLHDQLTMTKRAWYVHNNVLPATSDRALHRLQSGMVRAKNARPREPSTHVILVFPMASPLPSARRACPSVRSLSMLR